jgi:hypothetical protein
MNENIAISHASALPSSIAPCPENWAQIPLRLRNLSQWCVAGLDKIPLIAAEGLHHAKSTDPSTWRDFDTACAIGAGHGLWIGFMLHDDDGLTCIDLDVKDNTTQEQMDRFNKIVQEFDSFSERSRSGVGMHVWLEGKIGKGRRFDGVEVYSRDRFMICTGDVYANKAIEPRQELLDVLVSEMMPHHSIEIDLENTDDAESDWYVAQLAREDSGELGRLFRGDWEGRYPSQSEADLALVTLLARLTESNKECWSAFQMSALGQRDKAKRRDYMRSTLTKAREFIEVDKQEITHGKMIVDALLLQQGAGFLMQAKDHFRVLFEADLNDEPLPRWLVKRIIPDRGVGSLYGPSMSGKSFLAIHLLAHIANGEAWFGHKVTAAPTVYIPFEGKGGVPKRIRAWSNFMSHRVGREVRSNIAFIFDAINLRQQPDRDKIVATLQARGLAGGVLCIDTLAQSGPGIDENSSQGMGEMIGIFQELQDRLGGVILVIHHTGKDPKLGMRGWSGLQAAMDFAIECKPGRGKFDRTFVLAKVKDDVGDTRFDFTMERIQLGFDEDGDEISSLAVLPKSDASSASSASDGELAERDDGDDKFILAWIGQEIIAGTFPSANSVQSQLAAMKPQRVMTQSRARQSIHRLLAANRLAHAETRSPNGNKWLCVVPALEEQISQALGRL